MTENSRLSKLFSTTIPMLFVIDMDSLICTFLVVAYSLYSSIERFDWLSSRTMSGLIFRVWIAVWQCCGFDLISNFCRSNTFRLSCNDSNLVWRRRMNTSFLPALSGSPWSFSSFSVYATNTSTNPSSRTKTKGKFSKRTSLPAGKVLPKQSTRLQWRMARAMLLTNTTPDFRQALPGPRVCFVHTRCSCLRWPPSNSYLWRFTHNLKL